MKRGRSNAANSRSDIVINRFLSRSKRSNSQTDSLFNKIMFSSVRSQTTIFIIIAVVLIGGILIGMFLFSDRTSVQFMSFNKQASLIEDSIYDCFEGASKDSLSYVGKQGGYYGEPDFYYLDTGFYFLPFYSFGNLSYVPSSEIISEEIGSAFDVKADKCLDLIPENIKYLTRYKQTNVTLNENSAIFAVDLELFLTRENESVKIDFKNRPIKIDSSILGMNQLSSYIVYSYINNNQNLCLDCFSDALTSKGFNMNIDNQFKGVLIVDIVDNRSEFYPNDYRFLMSNFQKNISEPGALIGQQIVSKNSNLNFTAPKP